LLNRCDPVRLASVRLDTSTRIAVGSGSSNGSAALKQARWPTVEVHLQNRYAVIDAGNSPSNQMQVQTN
jgi:hypothetical protein